MKEITPWLAFIVLVTSITVGTIFMKRAEKKTPEEAKMILPGGSFGAGVILVWFFGILLIFMVESC